MAETDNSQEITNGEKTQNDHTGLENAKHPTHEEVATLAERKESDTLDNVVDPSQVILEENYVDNFEEIEEEYKEGLEENGEVKAVIKKRIVRVKKRSLDDTKKEKEQQDEIEEEYEEEELDESGEVKIVVKRRILTVPKSTTSRDGSVGSFVEKEEEYEEEEVDETGGTKNVKKIRKVRVPKERNENYEEVEEEYEEEELNEDGDLVTVLKKRTVRVPKKKSEEVDGLQNGKVQIDEEKSVSHDIIGSEEGFEEGLEEEESLEDEEVAEEEEIEGEEDGIKEEEILDEGTKKFRKKKKIRKEKAGSDDDEEVKVEKTRKRKRRRKRKSVKDEKSVSEVSIEVLKEEKEEEEVKEQFEENIESEDKSVAVTISSAEMRLAEERAAIAQQFEVLVRLRGEHVGLKKKHYFLTNKLVQYFKKQKMDHVFTEPKEDPDMEQRFFKKLLEFHESNQQSTEEKLSINSAWETQKSINEELFETVKQTCEELMSHKREVASKLIDPRTGRTILHDKAIEDLLIRQESQQKQILDCRLAQIKLSRRIESKRKEREMDHMGMDFNLMDYEKLSSLKEYYTDKITEREIEIGEVSQKMASMDDKLNNIKDELRIREEEMDREQLRLEKISTDLNRKRANLSKVKASKHKTEKNTAKIKQQSGLLAYPALLKDFEDKNQKLRVLTTQTETMKQSYRNNLVRIRKLRETVRKKTLAKYSIVSSSNVASAET